MLAYLQAENTYADAVLAPLKALQDALKTLSAMPTTELLATRYERLMSYGRFKEQAVN